MITAVVTARMPVGMTRADYVEHAKRIAERFQSIPGLVRKQFLINAEAGLGGGVYLWESRAAAEACYQGVWRDNFRNAFGVDPDITYFETPVIVDNTTREIEIAA